MSFTLQRDDTDILQVKISGEFTEEDLKAYMAQIEEILVDVPEDETIKSFIDTTEIGKVNPNLRRSVGNFLDNPKFGNTAVLGNSRVIKVMIDFVLKASGRHHMKYFTKRDEAYDWLEQN